MGLLARPTLAVLVAVPHHIQYAVLLDSERGDGPTGARAVGICGLHDCLFEKGWSGVESFALGDCQAQRCQRQAGALGQWPPMAPPALAFNSVGRYPSSARIPSIPNGPR